MRPLAGARTAWTRARRRARGARGSAAVEFVLMAPFVLIISAFVWDLRAYVSHRTDLAREVYVLGEVIADQADLAPNPSPLQRSSNPAAPGLIDAFIERFSARGAGTLDIAIVVRGATDRGTSNCSAGPPAWCPPEVLLRWPETPSDGVWDGGGDCAPSASTLPDEGDAFPAGACVLPNEDGGADGNLVCGDDGTATEETWVSRQMNERGWWVVVDICLHPGPGTFTGPLIAAGMNVLDFGGFTSHARGAWRSIHDRSVCEWCDPSGGTP